MDSLIRSQNENLTYDPQISGYDTTFWKTISGTAPTIASNLMLINATEIGTYSCWKGLNLEMKLTVPAAPTGGDVRFWGLRSPSLGNVDRVGFDITGAVFSAVLYDSDGNALSTRALTWSAGYTNVATRYAVQVFEAGVRWLINGTCVAKYNFNPNDTATYKRMRRGVACGIKNGNADNLSLTYASFTQVESLT